MSVEQFEGTVVSGCVELVTVELPAVSQQGLAEEIRLLQHHRLRGVSTVVGYKDNLFWQGAEVHVCVRWLWWTVYCGRHEEGHGEVVDTRGARAGDHSIDDRCSHSDLLLSTVVPGDIVEQLHEHRPHSSVVVHTSQLCGDPVRSVVATYFIVLSFVDKCEVWTVEVVAEGWLVSTRCPYCRVLGRNSESVHARILLARCELPMSGLVK